MASQPKNHEPPRKEHEPPAHKPAEHEHEEHEPTQPAAAQPPQEPPAPVKTIADEQRERSAEIERVGIAKYVRDHDERTDEERESHPIAGVQNRPVETLEAQRR